MIIYKLYTRKPTKTEYVKFVRVKCVDGKFYSAKPGKKYTFEPAYKSWQIVDGFLLSNFDVTKIKTSKEKPLTEVEWLDKVCENFKEPELDNNF